MILCNNVVNQQKTSKIAEAVLRDMKNRISLSLGPFGKSTIDGSDSADILITKDGYHLINRVNYNDPVANIFAKMYKDLSRALVSSSGDGSTSCLVAAYHFFIGLRDSIENGILKGVRQKEIMDTVNRLINLISDRIKELALPVSDDLKEIKAIASVSLNNNVELGEMIADIYKNIGREGYITVKLGNSLRTYTDETDGFMINFGRMDEIFVNNDNNESELRDSAIMIFNTTINSQEQIGYVVGAINSINDNIEQNRLNPDIPCKYRSVTIIAPGFGAGLVNRLRKATASYTNKRAAINFNLIQYSASSEFDREMLYDISIMCGAKVITESEREEGSLELYMEKTTELPQANQMLIGEGRSTLGDYLGFAKRIISAKRNTTFYGGAEINESIDIEKGRIKAELESLKDDEGEIKRKYELNKRLAVICKKLVTIYVGGFNETNRKTDMELIDDAVNACKSAIEHGYVVGGNTVIARAIDLVSADPDLSEIEMEILKIIRQAFKLVLVEVFGNKFDLGDEEQLKFVNNMVDQCQNSYTMYNLLTDELTIDDIINPANTDIEILKHVTTIISLIMTSNQFITRNANELVEELDFE
jgi:Chaperonin GroEL (HSP60 family)